MDRRTALKALAALPATGLALSAADAKLPTLVFDDEGRIANLDEVFRGVNWAEMKYIANVERREVLARLPKDHAENVRDEPPTWDGRDLVPAPDRVYHGVVRVRQLRYVKLPHPKVANPAAPVVRRTADSTLSPA